jgi:hypothetical protein
VIHVCNRYRAAGIPALAVAIAIALSTTPTPASARTFNFNAEGSMVQQPVPAQWGCVFQRPMSRDFREMHCH